MGRRKFWCTLYDSLGVEISCRMQNFWMQNDKHIDQKFLHKQQPPTKIQRRKKDHKELKEQVIKQKKEIEDGISYGKDNKADLGGNM
eukprot:14134603-Ditylum_brightwellii.AAC.1